MFIRCVCDNFLDSDWSKVWNISGRRQTSYDVDRVLVMVPMESWRDSIPFFGAAASCKTKTRDFRASLTLTSLTKLSTHLSKRSSLRSTSLFRHYVKPVIYKPVPDVVFQRGRVGFELVKKILVFPQNLLYFFQLKLRINNFLAHNFLHF